MDLKNLNFKIDEIDLSLNGKDKKTSFNASIKNNKVETSLIIDEQQVLSFKGRLELSNDPKIVNKLENNNLIPKGLLQDNEPQRIIAYIETLTKSTKLINYIEEIKNQSINFNLADVKKELSKDEIKYLLSYLIAVTNLDKENHSNG